MSRALYLAVAALLLVLAQLGLSAPANAAYPARPTGPVLDQAGIIPDADEAALDARLRQYNRDTGRAFIVATVNSLDGETVEMYAVRLYEQWGIGGKDTDQGVLFLIAPNERKLRFETGYGLHGIFPDVLAGRIVRNTVTPAFKAGDFPGGIRAGVDEVLAQLARTPADAKAVAEAAAAAEAQRGRDKVGGAAQGLIVWVMMAGFLLLMFGRSRRGARRSGIDPGVILWGISEIAHHASRGGGGGFGGGFDFGGGGGGFGGFGGGGSGGGGASGSW